MSGEIALDDRPSVTHYNKGTIKIEWKSGKVSEVPRSLDKEVDCKNECGNKVYGVEERIRLKDHCSSCYPQVFFGMPGVMRVPYAGGTFESYAWEFPVKQAASAPGNAWESGVHFLADRSGNNFGLGDIVLCDPSWEHAERRRVRTPAEGEVKDIHRYEKLPEKGWIYTSPSRAFLAKVDFGKQGERLVPSPLLQAQTDDHVVFSDEKYTDLTDVVSKFDPAKSDLKAVFEDPVARAIWMAYRRSHLIDSTGLEILRQSSLDSAKQIRAEHLPTNRVGLWFKRHFERGLGISQQFARFLAPYLTGEKVATYVVELD